MGFPYRNTHQPVVFLMLSVLSLGTASSRGDYSISNNLSGTSGGVESAVGITWIAAGFGSGTTGGVLSSVTLDLINFAAGTAEVDIYTDDGLQEPSAKVGALTLSSSFTPGTANPSFTASGITLTANTTYWVVLKALGSSTVNWSWTASNTGTGAGYQNTWDESLDSGSTWYTYDAYPTQMNVLLVSSSAVPEPSTWLLWGLGAIGVACCGGKKRGNAQASAV